MSRTVFMGSPEFAAPILRGLAEKYEVVGVVTQPDRPAGRGRQLTAPAVKVLAQELGLPVMQPARLREPEAMQQLRLWAPDLIVVAAFGQILRREVLWMPRYGCINVHASLLPRWRGAAPIQAALLAGDEQTGITIMQMDEGVDTGPILAQEALPIGPDDTAGSLTGQLSALGEGLLLETLDGYLMGKIQPRPQKSEGATYAPMLKKQDARLDLSRPAAELARRVRAFNPRPGAYLDVGTGAALKVHMAHATLGVAPVGARLAHDGMPAVGTVEGLLVLDDVQPAGKKPMNGRAFLAGARDWVNG
jgi:methionyl-tRNA formyltransferase